MNWIVPFMLMLGGLVVFFLLLFLKLLFDTQDDVFDIQKEVGDLKKEISFLKDNKNENKE